MYFTIKDMLDLEKRKLMQMSRMDISGIPPMKWKHMIHFVICIFFNKDATWNHR